jgi:hypothetical protein
MYNKKYMSCELDENGKEHMWQAVSIAQRTDGAWTLQDLQTRNPNDRKRSSNPSSYRIALDKLR